MDGRVPYPLAKLLQLDRALTKKFCEGVTALCPEINRSYRGYLKALEISCHGVPWLAMTMISIYLFRSATAREAEINLLFGLIYDIMTVAFVKAIARRGRPVIPGRKDDMFLTISVDKYSFPSGHATRAVFVALFFTEWAYPNLWAPFKLLIYIWAAGVCVSRILLIRHHILDVIAGIVIGFLVFLLVGILWIGPEGSRFIGDWIATSAEDEYH